MSIYKPEETSENPVVSADVKQQAVTWLVELQSDDVTDEMRDRWQKWRMSHPDHEYAWQRIETFSKKMQGLSSPLAHAALASRGSPGRRRAIKALTVLLFSGSGVWMIGEGQPWQRWSADYRTGLGEQRTATLSDGTQIALNSATAVAIDFNDTRRLIQLMSGEIMITTAAGFQSASGTGIACPLLVETAQGVLCALGTRLTVRRFGDLWRGKSSVAVFEGAVEIQPAAGPVRRLEAGRQAAFTRDGIITMGTAQETDTAWRRGMIVAEDMPLIDFLAELERHRPGWLSCDPAVAQLKVTGTYPLADIDRILAALQKTLPIKVRFFTPYWTRIGVRQESV